MNLVGNNALVTGGGRGIGKSIAAELLRRGATVTCLELDPGHARDAEAELSEISEDIAFCVGDVREADAVDEAFALAHERFGTVQMLVNNAGTADMAPVYDMTEEQWDTIVDTCMKGTFLGTRAYARQLKDTGEPGAIVNISSLNAIAVTDGMGHYCAAKAGVAAFTATTAGELGRFGIRVNAIGPGTTNTPLAEGFTVGAMGQAFLDRVVIGPEPRHGEPQDIANVTMFLLSDLASRMTGLLLPVDGGNHIRGLFSYWDAAKEEGLV